MADGLVVGVDTHKDVHVAVALDRVGRRLAVREFPATDAGNTNRVKMYPFIEISSPVF